MSVVEDIEIFEDKDERVRPLEDTEEFGAMFAEFTALLVQKKTKTVVGGLRRAQNTRSINALYRSLKAKNPDASELDYMVWPGPAVLLQGAKAMAADAG